MTKNSGNLERRLAAYGSMSLALAAVSMPAAANATVITHLADVTASNGAAGAVYFNLLTGSWGQNGVDGFSATSMDFELLASSRNVVPKGRDYLLTSPNDKVNNGNKFAASASLLFGGGASSIAKIQQGATIGPALVFSAKYGTLAESFSPGFGHWNQQPAWADVGLRVNNAATGKVNYGWANIQVNSNFTITLYEFGVDNSGADITASGVPEPASIVLLALGAAGIAAWRRKKATAGF